MFFHNVAIFEIGPIAADQDYFYEFDSKKLTKITGTLKINICLRKLAIGKSYFKTQSPKKKLKIKVFILFFQSPKMGKIVFDLVKGKTKLF